MASPPSQISVVIAAYNIENFIEVAVISALEQTNAFYEVIVINDASTDKTGAIIDRLAAENARLIVVHNPQNMGLGPVRNIGMDRATGDYICFLDGDDYFEPEAVAHLQSQVTTQPDVVLFNHARLYPNGEVRPNVNTELLAAGMHQTIAARKTLFSNLNVAWNKLYARAFLTRTGLRFPEGKYEDIGWSFLCLMQARQIVTTPQILLHYRQREGSILRAQNMTHFDIFDRWAELFAALDTHPDLMRDYGELLKLRRFKSLCTVLDNPNRVPLRAKAQFAAQIRKVCGPVRNLPQDQIATAERILDLPGGAYLRPYLQGPAIKWVRTKVLSLRRWLSANRNLHKVIVYRLIFLRLPINPNLVLYQSYWGKKIACNPYAIYTHLRQTRPALSHAWVVAQEVDLRDTDGAAVHLKEHSLRYYYYMARARVLVNNANFPDAIMKRSKTIHVQTKHGTPLKYMGLDQLRVNPGAFANPDAFVRRCARWDYVISSNVYSSSVWRRGFPYNYKIIETGYPRNDRLINATDQDRMAVRKKLGLPMDRDVVLYAPTFRPIYPETAPAQPAKEDIIAAILDGLGETQVLVVRDHYYLDPDSAYQADPRLIDLSHVGATTDVLLATDLLITDYSSIMFDYAVRDKPIVVLGHDLEIYQAARGVYFDIRTSHPGVFCDTLSGLTEVLANRAYATPQAQSMRDAFYKRFCHLDDGTAAQKVCDIVFGTTGKA